MLEEALSAIRNGSSAKDIAERMLEDLLPGGVADHPKGKFAQWLKTKAGETAVEQGAEDEMEHTKKKKIAKEIAKDHLKQHRDYYKKMIQFEKKQWPSGD